MGLSDPKAPRWVIPAYARGAFGEGRPISAPPLRAYPTTTNCVSSPSPAALISAFVMSDTRRV